MEDMRRGKGQAGSIGERSGDEKGLVTSRGNDRLVLPLKTKSSRPAAYTKTCMYPL